jgi:hypothetical protein
MDPVGKRPRRSLLPAAPGKSQNGVHHQDNDNDIEDPDDCDDDLGASKIDSHGAGSSAKRKVRNQCYKSIFPRTLSTINEL